MQLQGYGAHGHEGHGVCSCKGHGMHGHEGHGMHSCEGHNAAHACSINMSVLATCHHYCGHWLWVQPQGGKGHDAAHAGGVDVSCPHHALSLLSPSVMGHGQPLREGQPLAWRR